MRSRIKLIVLTCVIAGMFMGAITAGFSLMVLKPQVIQADSVEGSGTYNLLVRNGVSEWVTGTDFYVPGYGQADCYSAYIGASYYASMTVKLQHSSDALRWVDLVTFPYQPLTGTQFTRTLLYGNYLRAISQVSSTTTAPMTYTVRCVAKNIH